MKNADNKILIFYHFQLENSREFNVTWLPNTKEMVTIKDAIVALPVDLSQGLYHFRFKSEMPEGNDKITAWIDINNLGAKVPQVNGAIHIKILKLKDQSHNKLFHIDKLKKAEMVRIHGSSNHHQIHSAPKNVKVNSVHHPNSKDSKTPSKNDNNHPIISPPQAPQNRTQPHPPPQPARKPQNKPPVKLSPSPIPMPVQKKVDAVKPVESFIDFESPPKPKPFVTTSIKENLETFEDQFREEEQNRQNERIASQQLEETIKKWGYTDMKKINNTTTLLATLHTIWPEWQPVSLTDMLSQDKVNSYFKKAVVRLHPDKTRHRHFKEKYLSKRIFQLLNESRSH